MGQAFVSAPFLMSWLRLFGLFAILFTVSLPAISLAQGAQGLTSATNPAQSLKKATELAKLGRCSEALPLLKKAYPQVADKSVKRDAGLAGIRCGLFANQPDATVDFPRDPDVLYVSVHAYSDLSTRAAQELARSAPNSYPAHELNAESLELQG